MSYCRWSSDDFTCDVYVYGSVDDTFVTHVAGRKRVGEIVPAPAFGTMSEEEWTAAYRKHMESVMACPLVPIGLPHDGETFSDPDAGACADRLERLRELGYHVPQYAIYRLREEHAQSD